MENNIYETETMEMENVEQEIQEGSSSSILPKVVGGIFAVGAGVAAVGAVVYNKFGGKEKLAEIKEGKLQKKIAKQEKKLEKLYTKVGSTEVVEAEVVEIIDEAKAE